MILELFGSPGSGKTYAINQIHPGAIKEERNKKDYILDPIRKLMKKCLTLSPYAYKIRRTICNSIDESKVLQPQFKPVVIDDFIWNLSMLGSVYKYHRGNIFMDEGIVHRTISMCINYGIDKNICCDVIDNLSFATKDVRVLFLDVPVDKCKESIISRNRHLHSIDELVGERLDVFLKLYEEYCNYVFERFGFEKVNRTNITEIIN